MYNNKTLLVSLDVTVLGSLSVYISSKDSNGNQTGLVIDWGDGVFTNYVERSKFIGTSQDFWTHSYGKGSYKVKIYNDYLPGSYVTNNDFFYDINKSIIVNDDLKLGVDTIPNAVINYLWINPLAFSQRLVSPEYVFFTNLPIIQSNMPKSKLSYIKSVHQQTMADLSKYYEEFIASKFNTLINPNTGAITQWFVQGRFDNSGAINLLSPKLNGALLDTNSDTASASVSHAYTIPNGKTIKNVFTNGQTLGNNIAFDKETNSLIIKNTTSGASSTTKQTYNGVSALKIVYSDDTFDTDWFKFKCVYYKTADSSGCLAGDTLITLYDLSKKKVKDLTLDDKLLAWDNEKGEYVPGDILFIDSDAAEEQEVITLKFEDGNTIDIIYEHAFFDATLNKYLFLKNDAAQYIGHEFIKQTFDENNNLTWGKVKLIDVQLSRQNIPIWSPDVFHHLTYYVNDMLSIPGAIECFTNMFDMNPETMGYDKDQMAMDIEKYGLYTFEEFRKLVPLPEAIFEAFNGKYLKVAIGKGLTNINHINELWEHYKKILE